MLAMIMNWKETEAIQRRGDTSMKTQKMGRPEEYVRYPFISHSTVPYGNSCFVKH